ncbi:MAG: hypothetical protein HQL57_09345 [Magnetococcales bacterium]|nr:hypothetical protein [Magnetococcales bacterium]MBF0157373.1 hypothetical protein [Magnetococcales bacterium]
MVKARLLYHQKFVFADGAIQEMRLWQLPEATSERLHGLKYSLHYRSADGTGLVRYDNEAGKGDHRHRGTLEEPYHFSTVEKLVADFLADVDRARGGE